MRINSIKVKMFAVLALVAALFLTLADVLAYRHIQAKLVGSAQQQAVELLGHISREMIISGRWLPPTELGRVINFHLHLRPRLLTILTYDQAGAPLYPPKADQVFHPKYAHRLGLSTAGAMVDMEKSNLYAVIFPVVNGAKFLGSVVGLMNLSDMAEQVETVHRSFWLLGLATWIPLILALYGIINWIVLGRLHRLNRASAALAGGKHQMRAKVESNDEIGDLANTFNRMADHLVMAMETAQGEKNRLQVVLDTQNDGLFVVDADKRVIMVNRRLADMLGKSEAELIGRPCGDLVRSDLCRFGCALLNPGREDAPQEIEALLKLPDGSFIPIRKNAKAIRNSAGELLGGVETLRDISSEKELAALRSEWESFIRHELRTPLQPILGFSRLLAQNADSLDAAQRKEYLEVIQKSAQHLARLLEMTREVQLYETGQIKLSITPYDLVATLEQAAREAWAGLGWEGSSAGSPEPDWSLEIEPGLNTVLPQDPVKLTRVFRNLLENAWQHHLATVRVSLSAVSPDFVEVKVINQGEPISPERLRTIFEKYNTTKADQGGTGLGTTIARLFARAHGGMIFASSSPEEGTCFSVRLPRLRPDQDPSQEES